MTLALVALGSNLGDRHTHMQQALGKMIGLPETRLAAVSAVYETAPVGGPDDQGPYLNAAVMLETDLGARHLLDALHRIEEGRERKRTVRWGARTLDLDLLTHGEAVSDAPLLTLPHPRMHERRFVMVPVCDVSPDMVHPRLRQTMAAILADIPAEPGDLTAIDANWCKRVPQTTE